MIEMSTILESVVKLGVESGLLILFVWYFMKRDKERETELVEEKCKQREETKKQKEEIQKQLETYKASASEKEKILLSENAKREELIRNEAEKREQLLKEEAEKRENALMEQLNATSATLKEISTSMDGINRSMD